MPAETRPELPVLYRDDDLLIVNKPAGLVVHRGWATDRVTALDLARQLAGQWVYPAHRLDRGTSGVLVFGLSPAVAHVLERAFGGDGLVSKRYLALVRGMAPDAVRVDHPIAKEPGKAKLPSSTQVSRLACYVVQNDETGLSRRYSWVEARPFTGRPHQIRRHLKHITHPIVGDVRYGKAEHNRLFRRRFGIERLVLHAAELTLPHPSDGRPLTVSAALPDELARLLDALRAESPPPPASAGELPLESSALEARDDGAGDALSDA
jgi:tRNA pseudouridine65 synthase